MVAAFKHQPAPPCCQLLRIRDAVQQYVVFLLMPVTRMGERVCQLAIIGHQHKPFAVRIQPAHGVQPPRQAYQCAYAGAVILRRQCALNAARFVQRHIAQRLSAHHRHKVHFNLVQRSVRFLAQLRLAPVQQHAAGGDQFFAVAPRAKAAMRQNLLEAFFCHVSLRAGSRARIAASLPPAPPAPAAPRQPLGLRVRLTSPASRPAH